MEQTRQQQLKAAAAEYVRAAIEKNASWECTGTGAPLLAGTCTMEAATMAVFDALRATPPATPAPTHGTCPRCHGTNRMAAAGESRTCVSCASEAWNAFQAAEETQYLPTRATPPPPEAPTAAAEAGERDSYIQQAREALAHANGPAAEPAGRDRWARILASLMTGVLEEHDQQLTASRAALEDAFQEAARLQQELAEARAGEWVPATFKPCVKTDGSGYSAVVFVAAHEIEGGVTTAVYCHDSGTWHPISGNPVSVYAWMPLDKLPQAPAPAPPATPEAREAGGEEGGREV